MAELSHLYPIFRFSEILITLINGNLNDKMSKDQFIWHLQAYIVTAADGLFTFDVINGYIPISCHITYPSTPAQRHVEINYNPNNGLYYGETTPNLAIEVWTLYTSA